MNKLKHFFGMLAVALSGLFSAATAEAEAYLQLDTNRIDLGVIPVGQTVEFDMEFINAGDQPMLIPYIRASRREVQVEQINDVIIPHQWWQIFGTVVARSPGFRSARVTIYTSDRSAYPSYFDITYVGQ